MMIITMIVWKPLAEINSRCGPLDSVIYSLGCSLHACQPSENLKVSARYAKQIPKPLFQPSELQTFEPLICNRYKRGLTLSKHNFRSNDHKGYILYLQLLIYSKKVLLPPVTCDKNSTLYQLLMEEQILRVIVHGDNIGAFILKLLGTYHLKTSTTRYL